MTPIRQISLRSCPPEKELLPGGGIRLRSTVKLGDYPVKMTDRLVHFAGLIPDKVLLGQRGPDGEWRTLTYAQTLDRVRRIGEALLKRGLDVERPLAILSPGDLDHAILTLAAMHVGIPVAPVSPPYSLVSTDHGKLKHVLGLLTPGMIFAADGRAYEKAIAAAAPKDAIIVVGANPISGATLFEELLATTPTRAVDDAAATVRADDVMKIMFTSGSTGMPKGVIQTQRMFAANQQMQIEMLPVLREQPPVVVDWTPWNHIFAHSDFGNVLYNGGSYYMDDGRPVPGQFERTVRNLREIKPNYYYNVPKAYEFLIPHLRADKALRESFFGRVQMMFYAAAGLPQFIWNALDELALETVGERIVMITGLGMTETAPFMLCANWPDGFAGLVGVPAPGIEFKLAPVDRKFEARMKGPSMTPGYWRQPDLTAKLHDEEGFLRTGDAVRLLDERDASKGIVFDGRIAEDFKLLTGTWVSVGPLKTRIVLHFAPYIRDLVMTGADRDELGMLILADTVACRALAPDLPKDAPEAELFRHPAVRARFAELLTELAKEATGSATRVTRAAILEEPPSIDKNELTDKGSLNARVMLDNRKALVEELYADKPSPRVILAKLTKNPA
ncbi:MAG TPA: feruloyl-CoA synthase [Stellaceae bacterium]|nr:feruloyl-CoA synthase [Stellaceae bacterium]